MPWRLWLPVLLLGLVLFVWRLGCSGLVDETPPLFAASARAMAETGDWLIPRVNGLPRYDKPPLVYWLMGLGYLLPGQEQWNPLGTWAARMPSALSCCGVMLLLADTLWRWPQPAVPGQNRNPTQPGPAPLVAAFSAALAFALSPLVLLWGRTDVSDALLCGLVAASFLLSWRTYVVPTGRWWAPWLLLGLAVLTKGPVAVVLLGLTLLAFGWLQADLPGLARRLRPIRGLALTALVSLPWYGAALLTEGEPFWESFFGYHNLQRFTAVVNDHLQPWWFFGPVLVVASLPATPLLLLSLAQTLPLSTLRRARPLPAEQSLARFAACWLLAVLFFFTLAATKLPSYWLPATPAAALLISQAALGGWRGRGTPLAWIATLALSGLLAAVFLAGPLWVPWIRDPELPTLPAELLASGRLPLAAALFALAAALGWGLRRRRPPMALLALQLSLVPFVPLVLVPLWELGDRLRGEPVRRMAALVQQTHRTPPLPGAVAAGTQEPLAMIGILKPSLHYYARQVVVYEGQSPAALLNLAERLRLEQRRGQTPSSLEQQPTVLVVIDQGTAALEHWQGLQPEELGRAGLYRLWRLDRARLQRRAAELIEAGEQPTWQLPRPERY